MISQVSRVLAWETALLKMIEPTKAVATTQTDPSEIEALSVGTSTPLRSVVCLVYDSSRGSTCGHWFGNTGSVLPSITLSAPYFTTSCFTCYFSFAVYRPSGYSCYFDIMYALKYCPTDRIRNFQALKTPQCGIS